MKCGENESAASSHVLHGLSQPSRQGAGWGSAPRGHSETLGGDRAIGLAGRPRPHCLFPPPPHFGGAAAAPGWACNSCLFIQFYSAEIEFVFQFFPDSIKGHQLHCKSNLSFAMYSLNPS